MTTGLIPLRFCLRSSQSSHSRTSGRASRLLGEHDRNHGTRHSSRQERQVYGSKRHQDHRRLPRVQQASRPDVLPAGHGRFSKPLPGTTLSNTPRVTLQGSSAQLSRPARPARATRTRSDPLAVGAAAPEPRQSAAPRLAGGCVSAFIGRGIKCHQLEGSAAATCHDRGRRSWRALVSRGCDEASAPRLRARSRARVVHVGNARALDGGAAEHVRSTAAARAAPAPRRGAVHGAEPSGRCQRGAGQRRRAASRRAA